MRYLLLFLCLIGSDVIAETHGCFDKNGKPYFSDAPCKQTPDNKKSKVDTSIYDRIVVSEKYSPIGTITSKEKLTRFKSIIDKRIAVDIKPRPEHEWRFHFITFKGSAKEGWFLALDGHISYIKQLGLPVSARYKIDNPQELIELLKQVDTTQWDWKL